MFSFPQNQFEAKERARKHLLPVGSGAGVGVGVGVVGVGVVVVGVDVVVVGVVGVGVVFGRRGRSLLLVLAV